MRIAVIGSGYVGLVAGACFADLGHDVIVVDNDQKKLAALNRGEVPIHENFLPELLQRHRGKKLRFSDDLSAAVEASAAIFVAVGTPPTEQGEADLSYVESVARAIAGAINDYKIVVEKSTVPVYTSDWVRKIILRNGVAGEFDVASNPEFLREGTAVTDFLYPDRIVVGADTERCARVLREIYRPLTDGSYYRNADAIPAPDRASPPFRTEGERMGRPTPPPLIATSAKSAELIKHASNAYLAMKISFINAIGYGGSCFPKDLLAFRSVARECGYDFRLLEEVMRINEEQRHRFIRKVRSALWTLRGKKLGVLGLAFKGGTDDVRESPAILLIQSLLQEGCQIAAYDPAAQERAREVLNSCVRLAESAYDAARGADALLILTEWEEFAALDLKRLHGELKYPIVIDGRNLYDPEVMAANGFTYYSVGRSASNPEAAVAGAGTRPARKSIN